MKFETGPRQVEGQERQKKGAGQGAGYAAGEMCKETYMGGLPSSTENCISIPPCRILTLDTKTLKRFSSMYPPDGLNCNLLSQGHIPEVVLGEGG